MLRTVDHDSIDGTWGWFFGRRWLHDTLNYETSVLLCSSSLVAVIVIVAIGWPPASSNHPSFPSRSQHRQSSKARRRMSPWLHEAALQQPLRPEGTVALLEERTFSSLAIVVAMSLPNDSKEYNAAIRELPPLIFRFYIHLFAFLVRVDITCQRP